MKIAFFDAKPYDIESFQKTNEEYGQEIKYFKGHLTADNAALCRDYDAVCTFVNDDLSQEVINKLYQNNIQLIALRCAGYNNVDLQAVYKKIHVVRVPAYSAYAVAEHALALMLTLNRKTHKAYYRIRDNNFSINGFLGFDMHGKTAGIIGSGKIGRVVISILNGLGMNIIAYDKYPDKSLEKKFNLNFTDLHTLYRKSDIISLHCPLKKDSFHLINNESIAKMKTGVMIINTGRGQLIDTKALIRGLKSQKIGAAGLDVYEEESEYFFEDFSGKILSDDTLARLLTFPNVMVTSHQAFFTKEALHNIAHTTLNNIKAFTENKKLENEICYRCGRDECHKKKYGRCF
ncbi:MAG TPA: 2-hydroxyacid dehydrogenase [Spirochaetota bacterium]|nr:2-hydroxyacid dehydrogenase [Spirochaetota bacterium]